MRLLKIRSISHCFMFSCESVKVCASESYGSALYPVLESTPSCGRRRDHTTGVLTAGHEGNCFFFLHFYHYQTIQSEYDIFSCSRRVFYEISGRT